MPNAVSPPSNRFVAALPGWTLSFAGMALVGCALIVPLSISQRALEWEHQALLFQADELDRQLQVYREFHDAAQSNDPKAIERLAFFALHQRPKNHKPVLDEVYVRPQGAQLAGLGPGDAAFEATSIEDALFLAVADVPAPTRPIAAMRSRLVRLTRGPSQVVMLAVGVICIYVGLLPTKEELGESKSIDSASA